MTRWDLLNISRNPQGVIVHSFYQDDPPGEEFLSAFRNPGDQNFILRPTPLSDSDLAVYNMIQRQALLPPPHQLMDALFRERIGDPSFMQGLVQDFQNNLQRYPDNPRNPPPPPPDPRKP